MIKRITAVAALALALTACSSPSPTPQTAPQAPVTNKSGWNSTQLGLVAATGDPATMPGTPGIGKGIIYLSRVYVDQNHEAGTALSAVIGPGTGLTNAYIGVYDPATGKLLASTGDIASQFQTAGTVRAPFTTPLPAQAVNKELWLAVLIGGMTKAPTVVGDREYGTNLNLTDDYRLWVSTKDNFTTLPDTTPDKKQAQNSSIPFLAISP
ncbi:MAG TPA: hypothetical protein VG247_26030 [Pseudonocardiaceae bacterium]|jgi:hypothetical protein|nr:hypothetical protein [Pseudonocardiaceae bacterium]